MNKQKYLGETDVDIAKHPEYSKYTPADWAVFWIGYYGQYDGGHHKQWTMDQVVRILKGTPVIVKLAKWDDGTENYRFSLGEPSAEYLAWVEEMLGEEIDGEREYSYDEGIAP